jgi:hypothetical protein
VVCVGVVGFTPAVNGGILSLKKDGNAIRLVRQLPELQTVSTGRSRDEWDDDAFRDAGHAIFGG